jgi:hypothetical protein
MTRKRNDKQYPKACKEEALGVATNMLYRGKENIEQ